MLPTENLLDILRALQRSEVEKCQLLCRHYRRIINDNATTLPRRYLHEVIWSYGRRYDSPKLYAEVILDERPRRYRPWERLRRLGCVRELDATSPCFERMIARYLNCSAISELYTDGVSTAFFLMSGLFDVLCQHNVVVRRLVFLDARDWHAERVEDLCNNILRKLRVSEWRAGDDGVLSTRLLETMFACPGLQRLKQLEMAFEFNDVVDTRVPMGVNARIVKDFLFSSPNMAVDIHYRVPSGDSYNPAMLRQFLVSLLTTLSSAVASKGFVSKLNLRTCAVRPTAFDEDVQRNMAELTSHMQYVAAAKRVNNPEESERKASMFGAYYVKNASRCFTVIIDKAHHEQFEFYFYSEQLLPSDDGLVYYDPFPVQSTGTSSVTQ